MLIWIGGLDMKELLTFQVENDHRE